MKVLFISDSSTNARMQCVLTFGHQTSFSGHKATILAETLQGCIYKCLF